MIVFKIDNIDLDPIKITEVKFCEEGRFFIIGKYKIALMDSEEVGIWGDQACVYQGIDIEENFQFGNVDKVLDNTCEIRLKKIRIRGTHTLFDYELCNITIRQIFGEFGYQFKIHDVSDVDIHWVIEEIINNNNK